MKLVKVAAATLNQTPLAWENNLANVRAVLERARAEHVGILCLPELCLTGYGCEDMFLSPAVLETALDVLREALPFTRGLVVCLGLPLLHNKAVFNTSCLVADGKVLGFVAKRALAGDGIHYEPRWFKAWPRGQRSRTRALGDELPIGDVHFDVGGIKIGFEICEDAWIAQRPGAELALDAVDVILNPSASHFAFGKRDVRRRLVLEGSRAFGVSYVYANLVGNEAGRAIYDGDAVIATGGRLMAAAPRFSFADHSLITATVDIALTRSRYGWLSSFQPNVSPDAEECVSTEHHYPKVPIDLSEPAEAPWERSSELKEEEFSRALALGLFDYMRKSRSSGFVVSLSGGADSAAVVGCIALMVRFALEQLGPAGLRQRLGYMSDLPIDGDPAAWVGRLCTTLYQPTRNSGEVTRSAARAVAEATGARHHELGVDALVDEYLRLGESALGRKLTWESDDVALQNIQARVRAPSAWLLANVLGALLLSTSNRSEAAVGYATMDGDTAGGLSPIAGIDKNFLRRWLFWLQTSGPEGRGAIAALSTVTSQAPTAELRPPGSHQTDEADLMPYELLDAIERAAIRDKRGPLQVFALMSATFPQYQPPQLLEWVERFFRLWSRNQWKRERYAPSFHVDDANLDPKTWCRFPILSGGFERELAQLRASVLATPGAD
ncbi:MAG: NAD(+) synthase [Polyangiaceae bacterium]|nr:NAD(+) synthase [Polyangiaceae bacterium]